MMIFYGVYYSERARSDRADTNELFTNKIGTVQYNAALAITGCAWVTSKEKLYSQFGLTSPYARRRFHRLPLFYKILYQLAPEYLSSFIHPFGDYMLYARNVMTLCHHV